MNPQQQQMMMAAAARRRQQMQEAMRLREAREMAILAGVCLQCRGSGKKWLFATCQKCGGTGHVDMCQGCNGRGQGLFLTCKYCHGSGRIPGATAYPSQNDVIDDAADMAAYEMAEVESLPDVGAKPEPFGKSDSAFTANTGAGIRTENSDQSRAKKKTRFTRIMVIAGIVTTVVAASGAFPAKELGGLVVVSTPVGAILGLVMGSGTRGFVSGMLGWAVGGYIALVAMATLSGR